MLTVSPKPHESGDACAGSAAPLPADASRHDFAQRITARSASIIVNNFNYERYVGAAIESALAQTHAAQVVVVDDASTDGSRDVIARFGDRIVSVMKTTNGGQASAMNDGLRAATGDIVIFLDSDDLLAPTAVETLLSSWRPGTAIVQYPLTIIDADGNHLGVYPDPPSGLAEGDVRPQLLATGSFATTVTTGLAFTRAALASVTPIPIQPFTFAADGYLTRAVAFRGTVQRLEVLLGFYRKHGRNDSDVCAAPGGLGAGFRKKIEHANNEFRTTRDFAVRNGFAVASDLGERNPDYLGYRLFSLLLEPNAHPFAGDRRMTLLARYLMARWKSQWRLQRRVLAMALASAASFGTPVMSQTLIRWLHDPKSRPAWFPTRSPQRA